MSKRTTVKLTETSCKGAPANAKLWDLEVKGFALFTGKTTKTFYFQKDVHGKTTRVKIGNFPEVSAGIARGEAIQMAAEHATGVAAKKLMAKRIPTVEDATTAYLARPKLRSDHNKELVKKQVHSHLKDWLKKPLDEITKDMCVKAHARIAPNGQRAANHVLKSFRSIYNHARRVHDLPECPTMAIEWFPELPSQEIIDDLDAWRDAVAGLENPVHTAYYRFLLFTGLRFDEARSLRWDQVHDDHLHLPMTKNGRAFNLPLFDLHHDVLKTMRAFHSEYVFPGTRHAVHLKSPARIAWSAHTHRRTFATVATTEAELLEETVGRLLNHTPASVTGAHYIVVDHQKLRKPMGQVVEAFKRMDLI